MDENQSMYLTWRPDCIFVFQSFHTTKLQTFLVGCALSLLFCILSVGHSNLKRVLLPYFRYRFQQYSVNVLSMRIFKAVNKMIELLLRFFTMFLMMTMNGWVNICIAVGTVIGILIFRLGRREGEAGYKKL